MSLAFFGDRLTLSPDFRRRRCRSMASDSKEELHAPTGSRHRLPGLRALGRQMLLARAMNTQHEAYRHAGGEAHGLVR
jgi:hypothetical protein